MAIGYACQVIGIPGTKLSSCNLKNASEGRVRQLISDNLTALDRITDYNIRNQISLFRISSDIIPFGSHPVNQISWWVDYEKELAFLGQKIRKTGIRISMHPGQYTVMNSIHPPVIRQAVKDLIYHARFLDSLGADQTCKLILHTGGVYGNKTEAMKRFVRNYNTLPEEVKQRLVLENDERNYNISEVLSLSEDTGAPVVFDLLHHRINPPEGRTDSIEWIEKSCGTWSETDGTQKIHYSQQRALAPAGSHSDTIELREFLEFYNQLPAKKPDIMLEVKDKNLSAIKCRIAVNEASEDTPLEN